MKAIDDQRTKRMAVFQIAPGCAGFVNTFAAPTALKNIQILVVSHHTSQKFQDIDSSQLRLLLFWGDFLGRLHILFLVEIKGRTLEELDKFFEAKDTRKASTGPIMVRYTV